MTPAQNSLMIHTEQLLAILDEEIWLLELRRSQSDALSAALIQSDDARMEALLNEMHQTLQSQAHVDLRLNAVRRALADDLALPTQRVRLQLLIGRLHGRERAEMESRRQQIIDLAERLQRQHLQTSILLLECARINRMLLEALFPQSKGVDTYSSGGQERWWPGTGLVNAER
ncbi:MAG: hypothetical protein AMJ81_02480 [Phycisphaerae bacterium SM23_33]|nr:MAG: hypothetical protein AMJ81_02480 [Phycisphaerae bacterium SM23_33]